MKKTTRILLVSSSTVYGRDYLIDVEKEIRSFLGEAKRVLFFPFALYDRDSYATKAKARLGAMGYLVGSAHEAENVDKALDETDAIFIGGGNTFRLLKALQDLELIESIRRKVGRGAPVHWKQCRFERCRANDQDDERYAYRPTALVRLVRPRALFRSASTIRTPIPTRGIWARPRRNASCNSLKRTTLRSSECGKEPGWWWREIV